MHDLASCTNVWCATVIVSYNYTFKVRLGNFGRLKVARSASPYIIHYFIAVSEVMLGLDTNYYHIRISSQQLQEQSQTALLTVALSRPLLEEESIADAKVLDQDNKFELNSTTLTVYAVGQISPGRHNVQIVIIIGVTNSMNFVLLVPLTIDIITEGNKLQITQN